MTESFSITREEDRICIKENCKKHTFSAIVNVFTIRKLHRKFIKNETEEISFYRNNQNLMFPPKAHKI